MVKSFEQIQFEDKKFLLFLFDGMQELLINCNRFNNMSIMEKPILLYEMALSRKGFSLVAAILEMIL